MFLLPQRSIVRRTSAPRNKCCSEASSPPGAGYFYGHRHIPGPAPGSSRTWNPCPFPAEPRRLHRPSAGARTEPAGIVCTLHSPNTAHMHERGSLHCRTRPPVWTSPWGPGPKPRQPRGSSARRRPRAPTAPPRGPNPILLSPALPASPRSPAGHSPPAASLVSRPPLPPGLPGSTAALSPEPEAGSRAGEVRTRRSAPEGGLEGVGPEGGVAARIGGSG